MSKIKWHSGPPPHVGWWATDESVESQYRLDRWTWWRWWDGEWWSIAAFSKDSASVAAHYAALPSGKRLSDIVWCDYWPKNARVPRVDPR